MGCYINPENETKEEFLNRLGTQISFEVMNEIGFDEFRKTNPERLPVVLVDNVIFTAAIVCFCKSEYEVATDEHDTRERKMYLVKIDDLKTVSDIDEYLKIEKELITK